MAQFWIAGCGRSGTLWLARTLGASTTHHVPHEEAEPRPKAHGPFYAPFPFERWRGQPNYGECHGLLRAHLSPHVAGAERLVAHRYVLFRPKREIIRSWMNRNGHGLDDLPWIIYAVCSIEAGLLAYQRSDAGCTVLRLDELVGDGGALQRLADELQLGLHITSAMRTTRRNATPCMRWQWSAQQLDTYDRLCKRFADAEGI